MELKFGVLVSFTDGDYGDLSFYPDMEKDLSSDGKKYFQIPFPPPQTPAKYDPNRISWKADPSEEDNPVSNAMIINLPPWMENIGSSTTQVTGNIYFQKDFGNVRFHRGNIDDIDNRLNILFLSDGFDSLCDRSARSVQAIA